MMIGGGGRNCERADHGIGITEADAPSLLSTEAAQVLASMNMTLVMVVVKVVVLLNPRPTR